MRLKATKLAGYYEIENDKFIDHRGIFVKTFHEDVFKQYDLVTNFSEEYYSISKKNVIRGLHFQLPPTEHEKVVYCSAGEVMDVVVDLRKGSPTYGCFEIVMLSSDKANMLYIPKGLAHGFQVLSDIAIMMYKVTSIYSPEDDSGILWNSLDIPWDTKEIIMSERDKDFVKFDDFTTPFVFERIK